MARETSCLNIMIFFWRLLDLVFAIFAGAPKTILEVLV